MSTSSGLRPAFELLKEQHGRFPKEVVAIRVGEKILDVHTPIDPTQPFDTIKVDEPAGLDVIRHSSAHVMADAVQRLFPGTQVTIGPPVDDGFYYDFDRPDGAFSDEDLRKIESEMARIIKANTPFRRQVVGYQDAIEKFKTLKENYKLEIIESHKDDPQLTFYTHGEKGHEWIDFCAGPHVPTTGYLKAFKLTSVAGAYWRGDERNKMLQRIYGTAFGSKEALDEHMALLEEAKKRDHRKLGKELDLFMFHEFAPAMPFLLPRGTRIMNRLVEFVRSVYDQEGYDEVITPQIFDRRLFETSGHIQNYRENMYLPATAELHDEAKLPESLLVSKDEAERQQATAAWLRELERTAQKPMNCPSHCLIFGNTRRSYRELPMRVADFGRLHRYERGGVVHGLARVRSFSQDDAHIFCTKNQIEAESAAFLRCFYAIYELFGFKKIDVKLATRPEHRLGSDEVWDAAEGALEGALKAAGLPFEFSPGEGAFYGPKLEFHVHDALKRSWQLGTLQLDYSLPERFELEYTGDDGKAHRPVMLHRAWYGSLERFLAVLIEHVAGSFPMWLAPEHCALVTVSEKDEILNYGREVAALMKQRGLRVVEDFGAEKLGAKIRNARLMRYPYIAVIGVEEAQNRTLSPRSRELGDLEKTPLDTFIDKLVAEAKLPRVPSARG